MKILLKKYASEGIVNTVKPKTIARCEIAAAIKDGLAMTGGRRNCIVLLSEL